MKLSKKIATATVLAAAFAAAPASAITVNQVTSSTDVRMVVKDGVATLYGNVETNFERTQIELAAAKIDGVERIRNLIFFSN